MLHARADGFNARTLARVSSLIYRIHNCNHTHPQLSLSRDARNMSQQENSVIKMINVLKRRKKSDFFEIPTIEISSVEECPDENIIGLWEEKTVLFN